MQLHLPYILYILLSCVVSYIFIYIYLSIPYVVIFIQGMEIFWFPLKQTFNYLYFFCCCCCYCCKTRARERVNKRGENFALNSLFYL